MSNIDIHHLAAAYALDAVDDRERAAFEAHYHGCDVCRADVSDMRETLADLAAADPVQPSASVKSAVMSQIAGTRQLSPLVPSIVVDLAARRRRRTQTFLAVAAAVVLIAFGGLVVSLGTSSNDAFASELEQLLDEPDVRLLTLDGEGEGSVRIVWSEAEGQAAMLADGLDDPGDGNAYELWLIGADGPVPMDVLDPADDGTVRQLVTADGSPQAWGVTIEPASGSPAPTGEILYLGEV